MSILIVLFSFKGEIQIEDEAKFAILIASFIAANSGYLVLNVSKSNVTEADED